MVGKHLGKYLLGRVNKKQEDNINMDLEEINYEDWRWMKVA